MYDFVLPADISNDSQWYTLRTFIHSNLYFLTFLNAVLSVSNINQQYVRLNTSSSDTMPCNARIGLLINM